MFFSFYKVVLKLSDCFKLTARTSSCAVICADLQAFDANGTHTKLNYKQYMLLLLKKNYLKINSILLFFEVANNSITLIVEIFHLSYHSLESIAYALSRSFSIALRKKVLILFKVEKLLSLSAVVIGVVIKIFNNFVSSQKVAVKFSVSNDCNNPVRPLNDPKSWRMYKTSNPLFNLSLSRQSYKEAMLSKTETGNCLANKLKLLLSSRGAETRGGGGYISSPII